jgi:hypothetical protein
VTDPRLPSVTARVTSLYGETETPPSHIYTHVTTLRSVWRGYSPHRPLLCALMTLYIRIRVTNAGPIEVSWAKSATAITMTITLPPNTQGELVVPAPAKPATSKVNPHSTSSCHDAPVYGVRGAAHTVLWCDDHVGQRRRPRGLDGRQVRARFVTLSSSRPHF